MAFCRGFSALYAGEIVGLVLGNIVDGTVSASVASRGIPAFAGLAVLVAYLFLFTEDDFRKLSVIVDVTSAADAMREAIIANAKLSRRESQVLELALKGRTNERIAQELVVAKSTVDTHLRRIYTKAGVHSRQELIDYGERLVEAHLRQ
ncbi:MAG: helix-turn-helix transcriptional regulator [Slackia sp.]|nr:helix-turn-helix transcriptional regulator [Slackia sp.]